MPTVSISPSSDGFCRNFKKFGWPTKRLAECQGNLIAFTRTSLWVCTSLAWKPFHLMGKSAVSWFQLHCFVPMKLSFGTESLFHVSLSLSQNFASRTKTLWHLCSNHFIFSFLLVWNHFVGDTAVQTTPRSPSGSRLGADYGWRVRWLRGEV